MVATTQFRNVERLFQIQLKVESDPELQFMRLPGIKYVGGIGNNFAPKIMFIGEAPGPMENAKCLPFCGPAGKILAGLLTKVELTSRDVYITNTVKYMPTKPETLNFRKPTLDEVTLMAKYLADEIAIVDPIIICLLGTTAISAFYAEQSVRGLRGKLMDYEINPSLPPLKVFVTYHPSVLQYEDSRNKRIILNKDFALLASLIK